MNAQHRQAHARAVLASARVNCPPVAHMHSVARLVWATCALSCGRGDPQRNSSGECTRHSLLTCRQRASPCGCTKRRSRAKCGGCTWRMARRLARRRTKRTLAQSGDVEGSVVVVVRGRGSWFRRSRRVLIIMWCVRFRGGGSEPSVHFSASDCNDVPLGFVLHLGLRVCLSS
jgi:hypothetical protein